MLLQLAAALKEYDSRIAQLFERQADAFIWESFPGAGPTLAPRLCCAFGSERSRYHNAAAIQQYSGIAPVTERSGKNQHWVHRRWGRPHFIHQSFFEYANPPQAGQSFIAPGPNSSSKSRSPKAKNILPPCVLSPSSGPESFRGWRDRVSYDETTYLNTLKRRGSPLALKLEPTLAKAA